MAHDAFRIAMRRVATTVSVLSTRRGDQRFGLTVCSVMSLSMDPPTLCFSVHGHSSFRAPLVDAGWACVNVLAREQEAVGRAFSALPNGEPRFAIGIWADCEAGTDRAGDRPVRLPYLVGAQANLVCRLGRVIVHGTHVLCLAEVRHVRVSQKVAPLLYCDGGYRNLAEAGAIVELVSTPAPARPSEGWIAGPSPSVI